MADTTYTPQEILNRVYDPTNNRLNTNAGYVLTAESTGSLNPVDATTYYFGSLFSLGANGTAATRRLYIPVSGTIKACTLYFNNGVVGSNETSTASIRLNNTTDSTISAAVTNDSATTFFSNSALSIAVVAGDYIEIKWVAPTWVTNPTSVRIAANLYIQA